MEVGFFLTMLVSSQYLSPEFVFGLLHPEGGECGKFRSISNGCPPPPFFFLLLCSSVLVGVVFTFSFIFLLFFSFFVGSVIPPLNPLSFYLKEPPFRDSPPQIEKAVLFPPG